MKSTPKIVFLVALALPGLSCRKAVDRPTLPVTHVHTDLLDLFVRSAPELDPALQGESKTPYGHLWSNGPVSVTAAHPKGPPIADELFVNIKKIVVKKGGNRPSIIAPPPSVIRFKQIIPEHGALELGLGLGLKTLDQIEGSLSFRVTVNGEEVFRHSFSPGAAGTAKPDWVDQRIDLSRFSNTSAEIVLETSMEGNPTDHPPVIAGWSQPRLTTDRLVTIQSASPDHPNVLFVLVDTLRADHLGCYGYPRPTTPNLDAWAADAILFEKAYAQSSWTWPSTATLLSGLYPYTHGVNRAEQCFFSERIHTAAEIFQDEGFRTFAVSANPLICRAQNFDQGFENLIEVFHEPSDVVNRHAFEFLRKHKDERFFLYLHYMDPHYPYDPPAEDLAPFRGDHTSREDDALYREIATAANQVKVQGFEKNASYLIDLYDGEIRRFDRAFKALLAVLEETGLTDKTLIVFTSDHGEELFEHGRAGHSRTLYEEVLHVPMIIHYPAAVAAGREPRPVELIDTLPTLLALTGLSKKSAAMQGSALPLSGKGSIEANGQETVFATTEMGHPGGAGFYLTQASVRADAWKLIYQPMTGHTELYDLNKDPGEQNEISSANPKTTEELWNRVKLWIADTSKSSIASIRRASDMTIETLRNLGYVDINAGLNEAQRELEGMDPKKPNPTEDRPKDRGWDGKTFVHPGS